MRRRRSMKRRWLARGLAAAVLLLAAPALAQQNSTLHVTINHAQVIKLQAAATVAVIANPDIADIVNEKNNLIFVLGRKPGATNLLVYDNAGKQLLSREIVVGPEESNMVTITRDTDPTTYFCEPRCRFYEHEQGGAPPAAVTAGTGAGVGGASPKCRRRRRGGARRDGGGGGRPQRARPAPPIKNAPAPAGHPGYP